MEKLSLFAFSMLLTTSVWAACLGSLATYKIVDPIDSSEWKFTANVYLPETAQNKLHPVVFVLPTIVGQTVLEKKVATKICRNGMGAYVLNLIKEIPFKEQVHNLNIHDDLYVRALASLRHVISELKLDSKVSGEYGIVGASQGAMISTYLAGSEPLIKTSVLIAGAGNVPGVLAYSDQKFIQSQREARMEARGIKTQEEYQKLLADKVPNDPISVAHQIKPGTAFVFVALKDTTVPVKFQKELLERIPEPKVMELKAAHVPAIIKATTLHGDKIIEFLRGQFNL